MRNAEAKVCIISPATFSTHRTSSPSRTQWTGNAKGQEGKGRFSLTTSMAPTLPADGYTSQDLQFILESDTGKTDSPFPDEGKNEVYSTSLTPLHVPNTDGVGP